MRRELENRCRSVMELPKPVSAAIRSIGVSVSSSNCRTLTELKLDGFESAEQVHAYRVGQVTWATCRIRWKLTLSIETLRLTVDDTPVVVPPIALSFVVPSTVLARMDNDVLEAEVLDTGGPLRVEPASPA